MKLDKIKFAMVIGFIQRQFAITINANELAELDNIIDIEMPEAQVVRPSNENVERLMALMAEGTRKIEAIKEHRTITGMALKESKEAVERHWSNNSENKFSIADLRSKLNTKVWDVTSYAVINSFIAEL